jgi:hypothetical protein
MGQQFGAGFLDKASSSSTAEPCRDHRKFINRDHVFLFELPEILLEKERGYRFCGHACRAAHASRPRRGCLLRPQERLAACLGRSATARRINVAR